MERKRRTTLTPPKDSLTQAERIVGAQRSEEVLSAYKKAFSGFSDEEMLLLDGVVLQRPARRRR